MRRAAIDRRPGTISIQQESTHKRIDGSLHRRKTVVSYDETRNTMKQTTQESRGISEKTVSQKTMSSSSLKETQVRMRK